jgi:hypothetical protein
MEDLTGTLSRVCLSSGQWVIRLGVGATNASTPEFLPSESNCFLEIIAECVFFFFFKRTKVTERLWAEGNFLDF